jgi:maltose O-acetyltransferase
MIAGDLYDPGDPGLVADRARAQALMRDYNGTIVSETELRRPIMVQLFGTLGEKVALRAPVYLDYGYNVHFGTGIFLNYGCVLLDVCPIRIGDGTQIGPMVQILTADHPRDPAARAAGLEFGRPVTIGKNVWIGGSALILPGVTVADDAIIGAGAVVTRDVAPGATVVGNPARPVATS